MDIVYVDTETTGVQHFHELWEVAYVKEFEDGRKPEEFSSFVAPQNFDKADPFALRVGRYSERYSPLDTPKWAHEEVWRAVDGCILAGITVSFDARMIGDWFLRNGLTPFPWHYRLFDVSTYAAGIATAAGMIASPTDGLLPNSSDIFEMFDVHIEDKDRHTALGDARATRELHHAAMAKAREIREGRS